MKTFYFFITACIIIINGAIAQKASVITYRLNYKYDSTSKYSNHENFKLTVIGFKSLFQSSAQFATDSIIRYYSSGAPSIIQDQVVNSLASVPIPEFTYSIYKDLAAQKVSYVDEIEPNAKYMYNEPTPLLAWHINEANTVVNGYLCQQATVNFRGRQFTAWFTRTIPISDGPYKFSGLPGLIVRLSDSKGFYNFELTSLKNSGSQNITTVLPPRKIITTTREKFNRAVVNFNATVIERASQYGMSFSNPEAAKNNWKEKLHRRNNPLELR